MAEHQVGLLLVHGIGEQKRFETSRELTKSILAGLQARHDGGRFSLIDRAALPDDFPLSCPKIDRASSPFMIAWKAKGSADVTYLHVHEVWWSDLGAPATLSEQIRFWLWGLGQWNAPVVWTSRPGSKPSNTDLLMDPPTKFRDVSDPNAKSKPRPFARSMLFLSGLYAFLTLFSWEALKRAFSWLSSAAGSPSILTSYVGDVRIYTQAPGRGGGNLTDLGQPWRATIRRRMISELVAMAEREFDRWYVMGHSLGSVVAFNGVQEPEWNLPNYLDHAQMERILQGQLKDSLWITSEPDGPKPNLDAMMPRRPVWVGANDRISRKALFANFRGLITYGSPLDKFAALWPRLVPINKQRDIFEDGVDWINLSDATDPVGAQIGAFTEGWSETTKPIQSPINIRVKASPFFLLSHIRYFGAPKRYGNDRPETRALVNVLFPHAGSSPSLSATFERAGDQYGNRFARGALAVFWVLFLGFALVASTSWLALVLKGFGDSGVINAGKWLGQHWPDWSWLPRSEIGGRLPLAIWDGVLSLFQWPAALVNLVGIPVHGFCAAMFSTLVLAATVVGAAGIWRRLSGDN